MDVQHKKVFWIISILLFIILVASLWMEHKQDQKYTNRIQQLEREANGYEVQIEEIQNEMNAKQRELNRKNVQAWVLPCFVVKKESQLEQAGKWISKYKMPASFVVPVDIKEKERIGIFDKIAKQYTNRKDIDIMLSGSLAEKEIWNYISSSKVQIQKYGLSFSSFWHFAPGEDTEENIKALLKKDFTGYSQITTYGKTLISGEEKNGMLYIEYVPVKPGNNKIKSTLKLCKRQNNAAAISFDMETLGELDEKDSARLIKEVMKMIQEQRKSKEISVYNATQILQQNQYLKKNLQKKQKEYGEYAEKEKKKIGELQEKADTVWERWME